MKNLIVGLVAGILSLSLIAPANATLPGSTFVFVFPGTQTVNIGVIAFTPPPNTALPHALLQYLQLNRYSYSTAHQGSVTKLAFTFNSGMQSGGLPNKHEPGITVSQLNTELAMFGLPTPVIQH
jgi:hypothetical protein